ncbi:MAG: DNA-binding protein [Sulfurimonas sp.]|nr:MAG: DNA-binding protein [Sulfurimonas sp.]
MNHTIDIGTVNTLRVERETDPGLFLKAANDDEVLLPNQYVTHTMHIGDLLDVFVYTDSEDRPVASTERPYAMRGEFGFFEVLDITSFGAFVNWGLPKDLFVPRTKQKTPFKIGEKRLLHVDLDEQTHRLIGVEKIQNYLSPAPKTLQPNDVVSALVFAVTPLGYKVIVNHTYEGLIYKNEVFEPIKTGDLKSAFIKLRRHDGKLDISLQRIGTSSGEDAEQIRRLLHEHHGKMPYNYKSNANDISRIFHLSKKRFKRALTALQEAGDIEIKESGIYTKE